ADRVAVPGGRVMAAFLHAPPPTPRPRRRGLVCLLTALAVLVSAGGGMVATPALAQKIAFPKKPKPPPKKQPVAGEPQMLVQADEIDYDNANHLVSAVGSVQIYYKGSRLQADRVIYNQDTKRLHAEGNAILTDQN